MNRDGDYLFDEEGAPMTEAQPPFLLRWSPRLFQKEAGEVFEWGETTNRLFIKPGQTPPWNPHRQAEMALL